MKRVAAGKFPLSLIDSLLNLLFPPKCPACKAIVERQGDFCEKCLKKLSKVRFLKTMSPNVRQIVSVAPYTGGVRELIADIKFNKQKGKASSARNLLKEYDSAIPAYPRGILAVYVPISKERLKERGFNQVELIFKDWLAVRDIEALEVLIRKRDTKPQFNLSPKERKANIEGAFEVVKDVRGRDILLLDDIFTTGATVYECAKTLKEHGAKDIFVLTLSSNK